MKLLFMLFIYPLEVLMKIILEGLLSISASPFISLIGLSLAVTVISFPLSHLAEKLQENERNIQNRLRPKIKEFKEVFKGSSLNAYLGTLYRQNNYHPIYSLRSSFGLLIQIPFFFAAYHFIANYDMLSGMSSIIFKDLGKPDSLIKLGSLSINVMPFAMTGINILSSFVYGKKLSFRENAQLYGISILFFVVLYNAPSALLIYWTANNIFNLIKNIIYKRFEPRKLKTVKTEKFSDREMTVLFMLAALSLGLLLFIAGPSMLLASGSSGDVDGTFFQFFNFQFMLFVCYLVIFSILFYYTPGKLKNILSGTVSFLAAYAIANAFLFAGNYGDISNFFFENGIKTGTLPIVFNVSLLIILPVAITALFRFKKIRYLKYFFTIAVISLSILSLSEAATFYKMANKEYAAVTDQELDTKFFFSKEKNVLIIMMDRLIGGYMSQIFEMFPEIKETLDGFVWHPYSLSSGSDTISSEPSIMGGWDYHTDHVNKTRTDVPLLEKIDESFRVLPYNFSKVGFQSSIYARPRYRKPSNKYIENTPMENLIGKYTEIWFKENNRSIEKNDSVSKLAMFGLFRSAPPFLRKLIYDDGKWLLYGLDKKQKIKWDEFFVTFRETNKLLKRNFFNNYSTLDYLPEISEVSDEIPPQYYYFSNKLSHEPWLTKNDLSISFDGKLKYPVEIYRKFGKSLKATRHLYTDAVTLKLLGEWFKWMKDNGVYDNTRIIIISDHGKNIYSPGFKKQRLPGSKKKSSPVYWNNTFMVKDFNSHGKLRKDSTFMTTCDVPYTAIKGLVNGENPYTGNPIVEKKNKFPFVVSRTKWRTKEQKKYKFSVMEAFKVTDKNIFNLSNWKRVDD